jgi:hypothetical protein
MPSASPCHALVWDVAGEASPRAATAACRGAGHRRFPERSCGEDSMARKPAKPKGQSPNPRFKEKRSEANQASKSPRNHPIGPVVALLLHQDIERLNPREAAIIAGAFVENNLAMALLARLRELDPKEQKRLLDSPRSVLSDFSSKIDMGFALNLYAKSVRDDLDRIREIRNVFAHHLYVSNFDHREIAPKCARMECVKYLDEYQRPTGQRSHPTNRDRYIDTCTHLAERFSMISKKIERPPMPLWQIDPAY